MLWPQFWEDLTGPPGGADPHAQARELLAGHNIPVPLAFTGEQLQQLEQAGIRGWPRPPPGAGAPDLLDRYKNAPRAARALINAAIDARRLGMRPRPAPGLPGGGGTWVHDRHRVEPWWTTTGWRRR